MKAWLRKALAGLGLGGTLALAGCFGGGGTDVGNALVEGRVTDGGQAVAGARVMLMPEGYNPVLGDRTGRARWTVTDDKGRYVIQDASPGRYAVESRHPDRERMSWIREVDLGEGDNLVAESKLDTARTLLVRLPDTAAADAFVFIPGTDVQAARDSGSVSPLVRMRHAPMDSIPALGLARFSSPAAVTLFTVKIGPGDSVAVLP
jgi:hypothetical protein